MRVVFTILYKRKRKKLKRGKSNIVYGTFCYFHICLFNVVVAFTPKRFLLLVLSKVVVTKKSYISTIQTKRGRLFFKHIRRRRKKQDKKKGYNTEQAQ